MATDDAEAAVGEAPADDEASLRSPIPASTAEDATGPEQSSPEPDRLGDDAQPAVVERLESDQRLHASTLWLPAVETLIGSIIPVFIGCFFAGPINALLFFICFMLLPVAVYHAIRYYTLTFRLAGLNAVPDKQETKSEGDAAELIIQSGWLSRRERRIPLDRVQEVEIKQGLLPRLLGLASIELSTAGSDTQEASLNVLSKDDAEVLKQWISGAPALATPSTSTNPTDGSAPVWDHLFELDLKSLIVGGLTSNVVATVGAVIGAIAYFQWFVGMGDRWVSNVTDPIEESVRDRIPGAELLDGVDPEMPGASVFNFFYDLWTIETLPKSILFAVLGLAAAVIAYVVRFHGFRLTRSDDLMSTSYGLLTYRHGSLSRNRIQALKLEEPLLRRWCSLAAVRVDSAGDRNQVDENKKRDVLVPVASLQEAEQVACQAIPGLADLQPQWKRISRLAVPRGSKKGWFLVAAAMLQTYFIAGWGCLAWIPAFPLVYLLNYMWYRHTGYWNTDEYVLVRRGWINRSTMCVPVKNIQSVLLKQSYFDRRLNLATLAIDIAGQSNTGGGPVLRHVPLADARQLQSRLTQLASESEFRW